MLKVTYARFCDACGAPGVEESYNLTSDPGPLPAPPGPMRHFAHVMRGDLCGVCADLVAAALCEVFGTAVRKED